MNRHQSELAYRQTAVCGASGFSLLIALYDTVVGNVRRAVDAQRSGDIETRCKEVNHALLVLGYLENWIDPNADGELAKELLVFYANLRSALIKAQARQSTELFQQSMAAILTLRKTWQEIELRACLPATYPPVHQPLPVNPVYPEQSARSTWSA